MWQRDSVCLSAVPVANVPGVSAQNSLAGRCKLWIRSLSIVLVQAINLWVFVCVPVCVCAFVCIRACGLDSWSASPLYCMPGVERGEILQYGFLRLSLTPLSEKEEIGGNHPPD